MPKPVDDPFLIAYQLGALLVSAGIGLALIAARFRGPLLKFQPRKLVPWNAAGAVLAVLFVSFAIASARAPDVEPQNEKQKQNQSAPAEKAAQAEYRLSAAIVEQVVIVGGVLFLIGSYFGVSRQDLGLPANSRQFGSDVVIGVVASLAVLAPVYMILVVFAGPDMKSGHPLIKMVSEGGPNSTVLLLSSIAAVLVAPICEEIAFRLLLQGWLEKAEAAMFGLVDKAGELPPATTDDAEVDAPQPIIQGRPNDIAEESTSSAPVADPEILSSQPTSTPVVATPHGWFSITISAALFGLAHIGYGPEPIPLFFLGLALGYLYNRTHRIVPSMVAHAVFNGYTMIALWRLVFFDAG